MTNHEGKIDTKRASIQPEPPRPNSTLHTPTNSKGITISAKYGAPLIHRRNRKYQKIYPQIIFKMQASFILYIYLYYSGGSLKK
jgi:hypothetical protein